MHRAWGFLVELRFKVHRGLIAEGAVEPLPVVKDFDPFEDGSAGFRSRGKMNAMHQLAFEAAPKAFHQGIVVTVAAPAHARHDPGGGEALPVTFAGVLYAPVRVMNQSCR